MKLRAKSRRRLMVLLGASVGALALAAGVYGALKVHLHQLWEAEKSRGLAACVAGDPATALRELTPYIQHHGDDATALAAFAGAREALPEPDGSHLRQAIGAYERLVVLNPDRLDFRLALTRLYGTGWPGMVTPADSQAVASADALLARFGAQAGARDAVAEALGVKSAALARQGKMDDARQALLALAQMAPALQKTLPEDAQTALAVARHYEKQGNDAQAAALYRMALQFDPAQNVAMNNLAMLLARTHGGLTEAEALARAAVAAQPRTAAFHDTLAQVLRAERNFSAAQEAIGRAVALEPGNPEWRLSEAEVLVNAGQIEFARDLLDALPAPLPPELRARYDAVRRETGAPAAPQLHAGPPDD